MISKYPQLESPICKLFEGNDMVTKPFHVEAKHCHGYGILPNC